MFGKNKVKAVQLPGSRRKNTNAASKKNSSADKNLRNKKAREQADAIYDGYYNDVPIVKSAEDEYYNRKFDIASLKKAVPLIIAFIGVVVFCIILIKM